MQRTTAACLVGLLYSTAAPAVAQEKDPKPGFNLFSVEQDVEIGRQSAAEAERQLPVMRDATLERYLNDVLRELAEQAPGARYPYRVRAVDATDINAFTLPGGFLYVNRGLVEATRSESELAGVLAHEVAHVALRHGTHQASKAYAAQAGLGILGGLLGRDGGDAGKIIGAVGGIGLNAVFLKFGRDDEHEADLVGVRVLKRAGWDPAAMPAFFEVLKRQQSRDPSKVEQFFSSHPAPADREARLRAEAERLGPVARPREVGGYERAVAGLRGRPVAGRRPSRLAEGEREADRRREGSVGRPVIDAPASRTRSFRQRDGFFTIAYPENWRAYAADRGYGVVIAPEGAIQQWNGHQNIVAGAILNHYDPFDSRGSATLQEATDDLVGQVLRGSPHLRERRGTRRSETVDGARGASVVLTGLSPATGEPEEVTVVTRELDDGHVLYALLVAPRNEEPRLRPAFERMLDSLRVDDRVAHR